MGRINWLYIGVFVMLVTTSTSARRLIHIPDGVVDLSGGKYECKKLFYNASHMDNPFIASKPPKFPIIDVAILKQGHGFQVENEVVLKAVCRSLHHGFMEVAWGKEYTNVERTQEYQWNPVNSTMSQMFDLSITLKIHVATTEHIRVTCFKNWTYNSLETFPFKFSLLLTNKDYKGKREVRVELDPERENYMEGNAGYPQTLQLCTFMTPLRFKPVLENKDDIPARESLCDKNYIVNDFFIMIFPLLLVESFLICFSVWQIQRYINLDGARRYRQRHL